MRPEESLLANVKMAPRDAILGLTELYVADPHPKKVNLGVGVYYDDQGKVPLLECVRKADEALTAAGVARPYLAMDGFPDYVRQVQSLLFGPGHPAVAAGRVTTVQAVGGTGGHLVQEQDIALPLLDPYRLAGERRQFSRERGQLVVMRREEGAAAVCLVQ